MDQSQLLNIAGAFALCAMAFTILTPLAIAVKHCRAEKREANSHAENKGHSLS